MGEKCSSSIKILKKQRHISPLLESQNFKKLVTTSFHKDVRRQEILFHIMVKI